SARADLDTGAWVLPAGIRGMLTDVVWRARAEQEQRARGDNEQARLQKDSLESRNGTGLSFLRHRGPEGAGTLARTSLRRGNALSVRAKTGPNVGRPAA